MMMFLWVYVMTAAMIPGGERLMTSQANAFQAHMRAQLETVDQRSRAASAATSGFAR